MSEPDPNTMTSFARFEDASGRAYRHAKELKRAMEDLRGCGFSVNVLTYDSRVDGRGIDFQINISMTIAHFDRVETR